LSETFGSMTLEYENKLSQWAYSRLYFAGIWQYLFESFSKSMDKYEIFIKKRQAALCID